MENSKNDQLERSAQICEAMPFLKIHGRKRAGCFQLSFKIFLIIAHNRFTLKVILVLAHYEFLHLNSPTAHELQEILTRHTYTNTTGKTETFRNEVYYYFVLLFVFALASIGSSHRLELVLSCTWHKNVMQRSYVGQITSQHYKCWRLQPVKGGNFLNSFGFTLTLTSFLFLGNKPSFPPPFRVQQNKITVDVFANLMPQGHYSMLYRYF